MVNGVGWTVFALFTTGPGPNLFQGFVDLPPFTIAATFRTRLVALTFGGIRVRYAFAFTDAGALVTREGFRTSPPPLLSSVNETRFQNLEWQSGGAGFIRPKGNYNAIPAPRIAIETNSFGGLLDQWTLECAYAAVQF